jgi:hypothetical protein
LCQWQSGQELADLLHQADLALYQAKHKGRNRVERENTTEVSRREVPELGNVGLHPSFLAPHSSEDSNRHSEN